MPKLYFHTAIRGLHEYKILPVANQSVVITADQHCAIHYRFCLWPCIRNVHTTWFIVSVKLRGEWKRRGTQIRLWECIAVTVTSWDRAKTDYISNESHFKLFFTNSSHWFIKNKFLEESSHAYRPWGYRTRSHLRAIKAASNWCGITVWLILVYTV